MANTFNSAVQEQWSAYREDAADRGEVILPLSKLKQWYPYFSEDFGEKANARLMSLWLEPAERDSVRDQWNELLKGLRWSGMLMPQVEKNRLGIHRLREVAGSLEFRRKNTVWYDYLREVERSATSRKTQEVVIAGLWSYLPVYARLLQRARQLGQDVLPLLQQLPDSEDFSRLLPSQQVVSLLLSYATRAFARVWDEPQFNHRLELAAPEVRDFFADRVGIGEYLDGKDDPALQAAFEQCCVADTTFVFVQDLLDNQTEQRLLMKLPADYQARLSAFTTADGIGSKLKRFVGRLSIRDRARITTPTAPAPAPMFLSDYAPLMSTEGPKWFELDPEELTALQNLAKNESELLSAVENRRNEQLRQTLRFLTAPVLDWPVKDELLCLPQWQLAAASVVREAAAAYEKEQLLARQELNRIEMLLPRLRLATTMNAIREIERKRSPFKTGKANLRWQKALDRQRQEVLSRRAFREQKMEEFGVDQADFDASERDVWLDELLKVEEEVRPYMAYVRKAFQAALPVGSTIEFNPFRHRHDGVEFDPETVQDQDKWLRGEVMKTLRSRKEYAPITQVNTFCLDFSRSMNHDLMRNLYKVVFLLVTGLEGRDTYDAIHFFGSKFLAAIDFTDSKGFTSRSSLARILSKVATIERRSVIYSGFGGTNISDAVEKSHQKIMEFSRKLEEERPDVRYVRSILVLTDGQPTVGVINLEKLNEFIDKHRQDGNVSIKGIYLKHPDDKSDFIARIFGPRNAVEASSFDELIATFVQTMSLTYRQQRKDYRQEQRRKKLLGLRTKTD